EPLRVAFLSRCWHFCIGEIEFQAGADWIDYKNLIPSVLDVLFLKLNTVANQALPHFRRAATFEGDVIDATVVVAAFRNGAFGKVRIDMDKRFAIVVKPRARTSKVWPRSRLHT